MDLGFGGRTALITGAASGIGRATAEKMAAEGISRLVLMDRSKERLMDVAAGISQSSGGATTVTAITVDLADPRQLSDATAEMLRETGGKVDIAVHNAGICQFRSLGDLTVDDYRATMDVNFYPIVNLNQQLLPGMRERGRGGDDQAIVIVSSDLARQPIPICVDYAASKVAGLVYLKALKDVEGPNGIRVNAVAPGPIDTDLWDKPGGLKDDLAARYGMDREAAVTHELKSRNQPIPRLGRPTEVAFAICMLASPNASYMTGSLVAVDGGSVINLL